MLFRSLGIGGVIIGLWCSYALPPQPWVFAIRQPVTAAPIQAGDFLLVRAGDTDDFALVLLREPDSAEAVLVRRAGNGSLTPVGEIQMDPQMLQDWNMAGRVFFRFGELGGESVGPGEQRAKPSQD